MVVHTYRRTGGSGGVPPTMAKKVFEMSSRRLVLLIKFVSPHFCFPGPGAAMKLTILAERAEPDVPDPGEGCTPRIKIAILAGRGDPNVPDPCEGCTPRIKIAILVGRGEPDVPDPCEGCTPLAPHSLINTLVSNCLWLRVALN